MKTERLSHLCAIKHGGTPRKGNVTFWRGDIPWVSPKDMKAALLVDSEDHITHEALANSATSLVPEGSILIVARSGILAHSVPIAQTGCMVAFNQDIKALIPDEKKVDRDYLYWFLRNCETDLVAVGVKKGATVHSLRSGIIENLQVPLPSRTEQRRLVDLLSRAEGVVRLRRAAEKKAGELVPALFLDMFGDPGTTPKKWPVSALGDLLTIPLRNGISPSRSGHHKGRVLTLSAITGAGFDDSAVKDALFAAPLAKSDEVSVEDFLVCRGNGNRSLVGVGCFPSRDMQGVAFPDTAIAVRPRSDLMLPRFLATQWRTFGIRQQIEGIAKTTNGTYKINQTGLSGIKVIHPPLAAQRLFDERLRAVESLMRQQSNALGSAISIFDALLVSLFRRYAESARNSNTARVGEEVA